jgi:hypothetical protein
MSTTFSDYGLCHVVIPSTIAAELSGRHSKCRAAATNPACQPGAGPPVGGSLESTAFRGEVRFRHDCKDGGHPARQSNLAGTSNRACAWTSRTQNSFYTCL